MHAWLHYSIDREQWKNGINRLAYCKKVLNDPARQQHNSCFTNPASS